MKVRIKVNNVDDRKKMAAILAEAGASVKAEEVRFFDHWWKSDYYLVFDAEEYKGAIDENKPIMLNNPPINESGV